MPWFGKSAQQKRINADALVIADLRTKLAAETERANRIAGRLARAEGLLAAARIERATAQTERDSYRERLLLFTAPRERGPGGRFLKPPVAAAEMGAGL